MIKKAVAYANNDIAFIAWSYDAKIKDCLGFAVWRVDAKTKQKTALPAWVGFKNQSNTEWKRKDTTIWPIQKFNWSDFKAQRGGCYNYEIVPMIGEPDNLKADYDNLLVTSNVTLSSVEGNFRAYFNRGILSTQSLAHLLPKSSNGTPDYSVLLDRINQPGDTLRESLAGQMIEGLSSILERAKDEGGSCYCALYELNDPHMLKLLLDSQNVHILLANTGEDDEINAPAREALHNAKIDITDCMLKRGHIGHNKFVVYVDRKGKPQAVLTGSTNWTCTGICAQSNNAIIIESPELASIYLDYWKCLKSDGAKQCAKFRASNKTEKPTVTIDGSEAKTWFAPNTKQQSKPAKNPAEPPDIAEINEAISNANKAVLFLLFQPGTPCVTDAIARRQNDIPDLFVRGAVTDPKAVENYEVLLFHRSAHNTETVVAASALNDQFAYWQKELLKASPGAHAIIHDKIIVIDPNTDNSVVITGSHNLGYRASYTNNENLLIVRGNRALAQMYAVHVMDIYGHYRWRYHREKNEGITNVFFGLETDDSWQDKYFSPQDLARNDLKVWFE